MNIYEEEVLEITDAEWEEMMSSESDDVEIIEDEPEIFNAVYRYFDPCWHHYYDAENKCVFTVGYAFDGVHSGCRKFTDEEWDNRIAGKHYSDDDPVRKWVYIPDDGDVIALEEMKGVK